jgi:inhibitor of cysteine peptidase
VKTNKFLLILSVLTIALLLVACTAQGLEPAAPQSTPAPDTPVDSNEPPMSLPPVNMENVIVGEAYVESVELLILESFPVQVHAVVKGHLADGCTSIGEVEQTRKDNVITITVSTVRPAEAMCTMALIPFETTVPLEVEGLTAGEYTVQVNETSETFKLDVDNRQP